MATKNTPMKPEGLLSSTITIKPSANLTEGEVMQFACRADADVQYAIRISPKGEEQTKELVVVVTNPIDNGPVFSGDQDVNFETAGYLAGTYTVAMTSTDGGTTGAYAYFHLQARQDAGTNVTLQHSGSHPTDDQNLWAAIRNRTAAVGYQRYEKFISLLFSNKVAPDYPLNGVEPLGIKMGSIQKTVGGLNVQGPYAYSLLKFATQVFLTLESGVLIREDQWSGYQLFDPKEEALRLGETGVTPTMLHERLQQYLMQLGRDNGAVLPYLNRIVDALIAIAPADQEVLPYGYGVLQHRFTQPSLIELIWSYWHEEGMLAQTMNAIAYRFQNQRSGPNDPLGELEIDPLRPLNNMIWGFVQDEHNRLSVRRRAFEYDHHYGLKLVGRAVPELQSADSRSKFIETFHNLLYRTAVFYREDADTTVIPDAFPLLNALKDAHLLLAEGAHNQYGDLPWTARAEMLTQQWMLARPEMREFLRGRHMVPYQEPWMGAVDAMKKLQGWSDTTITHFNELAVDGERLLLSIRFGDWSDLKNTEEQAKNWARYWKPEIQRYLYGYLAVTGVDLMADITDNREASTRNLQPSALLQRRLAAQTRQPTLAAPRTTGAYTLNAGGYAELPGRSPMRALKYEKGE